MIIMFYIVYILNIGFVIFPLRAIVQPQDFVQMHVCSSVLIPEQPKNSKGTVLCSVLCSKLCVVLHSTSGYVCNYVD